MGRITDNIFKCVLLMMVVLPMFLLFHERLILKAVGVAYIFGLWWLVREHNKVDGNEEKG